MIVCLFMQIEIHARAVYNSYCFTPGDVGAGVPPTQFRGACPEEGGEERTRER